MDIRCVIVYCYVTVILLEVGICQKEPWLSRGQKCDGVSACDFRYLFAKNFLESTILSQLIVIAG